MKSESEIEPCSVMSNSLWHLNTHGWCQILSTASTSSSPMVPGYVMLSEVRYIIYLFKKYTIQCFLIYNTVIILVINTMLFSKYTIQCISSPMGAVASCMFTYNVGIAVILLCLVISIGSQTFWWCIVTFLSLLLISHLQVKGHLYSMCGPYIQLTKKDSYLCFCVLQTKYNQSLGYNFSFSKKKKKTQKLKLLEENIGRTVYDINHSKILYDLPPKIMGKKVDKGHLIKLESFSQQTNYKQDENQPWGLEKIKANETTDKRLISKIYKHHMKLNTRKQGTQSRSGQKT